MMRMFLQVFVSIAFFLNLCGAFVLCNGPCSVKSKPAMSAVQNPWVSASDKVSDLRRILFESDELTIMPCCYDGLTARLVEQSGFKLTFMTGFGVSSTYGLPDTGLISSEEMIRSASTICNSLQSIPCIGDGDTGYGNAMNVKRTVAKYSQAGLAGIMIEDQILECTHGYSSTFPDRALFTAITPGFQVAPKRCGHTIGKSVVDRDEAYRRVKAAVDARNEGADIVILARTDSRALLGIDEAIERCKMFREIGADWTFLEAPQSEEEMIRYCIEVDGPKLANMLEGGRTPILSPKRLKEIGYTVAAYPLTLLSASVKAMQSTLQLLKEGQPTDSLLLPFTELQDVVGFTEYNREADRYKI